jgi:DNA-binding response OmpR family regulator
MANERILLVDDDVDMLEVATLYLNKNKYCVFSTENGFSAIDIVETEKPDLIILDVNMPNLDGFELCQIIRKKTDVPILFLTSRVDDLDEIIGLGIGADDYISKTTSMSVVVAKVKAHLRRSRVLPLKKTDPNSKTTYGQEKIEYPGLLINLESAAVYAGGVPVKLSAKEYQLLCLMAQNPERVYSVEQLFELIWDEKSLGDHRTVMVHISNLRKKIEVNPDKPRYIKTFRGIGYKFNHVVDL